MILAHSIPSYLQLLPLLYFLIHHRDQRQWTLFLWQRFELCLCMAYCCLVYISPFVCVCVRAHTHFFSQIGHCLAHDLLRNLSPVNFSWIVSLEFSHLKMHRNFLELNSFHLICSQLPLFSWFYAEIRNTLLAQNLFILNCERFFMYEVNTSFFLYFPINII